MTESHPHTAPEHTPPIATEQQGLDIIHEQERATEPDFAANVARLEELARNGIETPEGVKPFEFRAGIEIEYVFLSPDMAQEELASASKRNGDAGRDYVLGKLLNPEALDKQVDRSGVEAFREQARDFVRSLPSGGTAQEMRRQAWMQEIDEFGLPELINFQLYSEFSKPTLDVRSPKKGATLEELDAFAEQQGWIEFRFGKGKFQSGYYDNENVCELRTAPAEPSEAVGRRTAVLARLREIATQYGVVVHTSADMEHVNISAYTPDEEGEWTPVIGNAADRQAITTDMVGGIAAAFEDGYHLHAKDMKWDYKFDDKFGGDKIRIGATRKSLRILDDRLELRSGFQSADQAANWLTAGMIYGLQQGADKIEQDGYDIPRPVGIYHVMRGEGFVKDKHLQVQRSFENSEFEEGKFHLNIGYNMLRSEEITTALIGDENVVPSGGNDFLNGIIISAVKLDESGVPSVTTEALLEEYGMLRERERSYLAHYDLPAHAAEFVPRINDALRTVRLQPSTVIQGEIRYAVPGRQAAYDRLAASPIAPLALTGDAQEYTAWLRQAAAAA